MPVYQFIKNPNHSDCTDILSLYCEQGWWGESSASDSELVRKIVNGTYLFIVARQANQIIGMARAISDGVSDAYIQDVTVLNGYRHNGTGAILIQKLVQRLNADGIRWIGLIAEKGSEYFYLKQGFKRMDGATPMLKLDL